MVRWRGTIGLTDLIVNGTGHTDGHHSRSGIDWGQDNEEQATLLDLLPAMPNLQGVGIYARDHLSGEPKFAAVAVPVQFLLSEKMKQRAAFHRHTMHLMLSSIQYNLNVTTKTLNSAGEEMAFLRGIITTYANGRSGMECPLRIHI